MEQIEVNGLCVDVVRKDIKNLHLGVYPPDGRVRVAAPSAVSDEAVRQAVITRQGWIRRQQERFALQERQSQREMIDGESHYFAGQRYRLKVFEGSEPSTVILRNKRTMELHVPPGSSREKREEVLLRWYRQQLKRLIPEIISKWEPILGIEVTEWGVKRMKTKWGSCNPDKRRIWLNLELVKKDVKYLEYIVLHEMVHILERTHNDRFREYMDRFMPSWQMLREELNQSPLKDEQWMV
jgi:predicted metal-dependent hydrolase